MLAAGSRVAAKKYFAMSQCYFQRQEHPEGTLSRELRFSFRRPAFPSEDRPSTSSKSSSKRRVAAEWRDSGSRVPAKSEIRYCGPELALAVYFALSNERSGLICTEFERFR